MNQIENPQPPRAASISILVYVFKYGLVGWGLGSGIAYVAIEGHRHPQNLGAIVAWAAWFFPLLGMGAGLMMWVIGRVFGKQMMGPKRPGNRRR